MSNKIKISILILISVFLLIYGYYYLIGKNLFTKNYTYYAVFTDANEILISNPVFVNGVNIGNVADINPVENDLRKIVITIKLTKSYKLPNNSMASIKTNALGISKLVIELGSSNNFLKIGDTIRTVQTNDFVSEISNAIKPAMNNITSIVHSADSILLQFKKIMNEKNQENIQTTLSNFAIATKELTSTLQQINSITSPNSKLSETITHLNNITLNIENKKDTIAQSIQNIHQFTNNLSKANITKTVDQFNQTIEKMNTLLTNVQAGKGTLGQLVTNQDLYKKLEFLMYSLNTLLDDIKIHPSRYIKINVFGKKDKTVPLSKPIYDSLNK